MTWIFPEQGCSKGSLVEHLRRPGRFNSDWIKTSLVGNHHWYVCKSLTTGLPWIGLDHLRASHNASLRWGFAQLTEVQGFTVLDCPEAFLAMTSLPPRANGRWRQEVRRRHGEQHRSRASVGETVYFRNRFLRLVSKASPQGDWTAQQYGTKQQVRMTRWEVEESLLRPTVTTESATESFTLVPHLRNVTL